MRAHFDFDDDNAIGHLFENLEANWFEWDFDTITKDMSHPFPLVCLMYEYTRSMPDLKQSVLEALHEGKPAHEFDLKHLRPERREHVTKLITDFPEWPARPFIFTNPQHWVNYVYKGWRILKEDSPLAPFMVDFRISNKDNRRLFDLWLKDKGTKEQKNQRGAATLIANPAPFFTGWGTLDCGQGLKKLPRIRTEMTTIVFSSI